MGIQCVMATRLRIEQSLILCFSLFFISICPWARCADITGDSLAAQNDVTWTSPGRNENDSMPIGNGDIAVNAWTETNGDLVLLVAKSDALTEWGKLVKLGRVRVQFSPNPFVGAADFSQTLHVENGSMEITSGGNSLRIWVDANHPVMHLEAKLDTPAALEARLELWRTKTPDNGGVFELTGNFNLETAADTVFPAQPGLVTWCHFNPSSIYPIVLQEEHLASIAHKYPDPLLHRCFGAALSGTDLESGDDHTLKSKAPARSFRLNLTALTETQVKSPQAWRKDLVELAVKDDKLDPASDWQAHEKWWRDFWNRSWIRVDGTDAAAKVSQGYAMQRYMMACSSRGALPAKFNGGLFTVGHDLPEGRASSNQNHNADFRAWGNSYWNQNNRLLYWPLIATGDYDLLQPWFNLYLNVLPLAEDRTKIYFQHDGASLPETMLFWGLPNLTDFGRNNPSFELQSNWQRYHIQGTLEVIAQMLDYYDQTRDAGFARKSLVAFADPIVTYYDEHWPRDASGKIHMAPVQSLETYQLNAVNPTPDIAGLKSVLPRLLALPGSVTTRQERELWTKVLRDLPPIPMGTTARGKLPPLGAGDSNGTPIILPAEKYGRPANVENPELYVAFPYRLYGVGKPDLKLAQDTFAARVHPQNTCWGQDGTQASILGLTGVAQKAAIAEFTDYGNQRFRWFWSAGNDWIPDLDNGGSGMITLQNMLMQCDGRRIQLLPAWPRGWTADFKLHAPDNTTVEGHVENGAISNLKVTPASRAKDVIVVPVP